jgi:exopolysaccharide biosynthesis polyprenyl glycosylphosphotransferase
MFQRAAKIPPILLFFIDAAIINFSFAAAYYIRFEFMIRKLPAAIPSLHKFYGMIILVTLLWLALFKLLGLYDKKDITSAADEASSIIGATIIGTLSLLSLLFLYRGFWFSRGVLLYSLVICSVLMILARYILSLVQREMYRREIGLRRTLIIGAGEIGQMLAAKMIAQKDIGYKVIGFLDDDPAKKGQKVHGLAVFDSTANIRSQIKQLNINEVIVSSGTLPSQKILDIITECEVEGVEFKLVPGILELIASRISTDEIGGVPLLTVKEIKLQGMNAFMKRMSDFLFSATVLSLLSPILLIVIILIRLDSKGPIFFTQKRVGKDGRDFDLFKFRSMIFGAEELFEKVVKDTGGDIIRFKAKADPRITRIGKYLRKFSIDEVPQFINVLKGDMSIVGPRPPVPIEVERYSSWHKKRLRVRPGITGLWQVSGRSELPFEDMVRLDIYYIENWSLWMDFRIVLRTIPTVLFGSGAY